MDVTDIVVTIIAWELVKMLAILAWAFHRGWIAGDGEGAAPEWRSRS